MQSKRCSDTALSAMSPSKEHPRPHVVTTADRLGERFQEISKWQGARSHCPRNQSLNPSPPSQRLKALCILVSAMPVETTSPPASPKPRGVIRVSQRTDQPNPRPAHHVTRSFPQYTQGTSADPAMKREIRSQVGTVNSPRNSKLNSEKNAKPNAERELRGNWRLSMLYRRHPEDIPQ